MPFRVRGILIDEDNLLCTTSVRVSTEDEGASTLLLRVPPMRGDDVSEAQRALVAAGFAISDDGIFGPGTEAAVKLFQQQRRLKVDGIVGPATRSALGL